MSSKLRRFGVAVKYAYPGISVISSNYTSGFIDHLESTISSVCRIPRLIKAQIGLGLVVCAKFILPVAYYRNFKDLRQNPF